jgi:hypothetical protein
MTIMTTMNPTDVDGMQLETRFWDAMKTGDTGAAGRMTADGCLIVGASGASVVDPRSIAAMLKSAPYEIRSYRIDPSTMSVRRLSDDMVVTAYGVHEDLVVEGKDVSLDAFDSSVWQRRDGRWTCVLHTESIAGDPFGRDRRRD